ncbi:MAG: hypothetical protein ACI89Z_000741 [Porticoccus sp.]
MRRSQAGGTLAIIFAHLISRKVSYEKTILLCFIILQAACASIVNDANIPITASFSDGSAGKCVFHNKRGSWPSAIPNTVKIRRSDVLFKRVYHNNFETYGRLHCGPLQNLPKDLRPYICFNNEPTVEIGIVSSHVLLAYALSGEDLTVMPPAYALDNVQCDKNGDETARINRTILKGCLLRLLNGKLVSDCAKGLDKWRLAEEGKDSSFDGAMSIDKIAKVLPLFDWK